MTEQELREDIITEGATLRAELLGLLQSAYSSRFGFILGGRKLKQLEKSFYQLHGKFLVYDGRIFEFLSETTIARGIEPWAMEIRKMGWNKLYAQREILLSLVNHLDGGLGNARSELLNKRAILIALIALVVSTGLAIISIYVAVSIGEPIVISPP